MEKISEHITWKEATFSETAVRHGIKNEPDEDAIFNMKFTAEAFEKIRNHFGVPIFISSFFRSKELNLKIGGAESSQHCTGQAIDIDADRFGGVENKELFAFIYKHIDFDQLIWEYGDNKNPDWVHFSINIKRSRREVLKATKSGYLKLNNADVMFLI